MSEEKFFSQVRESLSDYAPEVPAAVYSGMRRKLWWSGFTQFNASRLNMWYVLIAVGLASGAVAYSTGQSVDAIRANEQAVEVTLPVETKASCSTAASGMNGVSVASLVSGSACASSGSNHNVQPAASSTNVEPELNATTPANTETTPEVIQPEVTPVAESKGSETETKNTEPTIKKGRGLSVPFIEKK